MRLLYLADAPYIHTKRWVEHFARLGHDCEVISFRPAAIEGARVTYVDGLERLGKLRYLLWARRVARLIQQRAPDIVHALHLTSYGFLGALSGVHPLVLSAWGTDILEAPRLTPFHAWLTRYTLRHVDLITATGPYLASATAKYAPPTAEIEVVPYGVDLDRFQPQSRLERRPLVVGSVARLSSEKGIRFLIQAFALLSSDTNELVLEIAGDGPERRHLEELVRQQGLTGRVRFRGWVDHKALPAFLAALDVFVLPSLFEGFGVAAVEASAMALPVVGSRIHGIPDVVVEGETGLLVSPADPPALAAAIQALVDDPALRVRLGEAGRAFVAGRYDWRENAVLMEGLYERYCLQAAQSG